MPATLRRVRDVVPVSGRNTRLHDSGTFPQDVNSRPVDFCVAVPAQRVSDIARWKRTFDVVFSLSVLVLTAPLLLVIAVWIKLSRTGPVFFRQQRVGEGGRLFLITKFRTMHVDAPAYAETPHDDDLDPRVTKFGRILRKSGLDELPQFWSVLRGEMSVVGPRPEMPFIADRYTPRQRRRLAVRPGITGPWQVSDARREPIHQNLHYDIYYIRHCCLWLDVRVIAATAWIALVVMARTVRRNARRMTSYVKARSQRVDGLAGIGKPTC